MTRLIDADEFIYEMQHSLWDWNTLDGISATTALKQTITDLKNHPSVDATPVVHAHWVPHEELDDCAYCSNCNGGLVKHFWVRPFDWDWCPDCGAKMDEEADNGR